MNGVRHKTNKVPLNVEEIETVLLHLELSESLNRCCPIRPVYKKLIAKLRKAKREVSK